MYVKNLVSLLLLNCLCISAAFGQAIGISGVADRSAYNNQASFLITNSAGFTYSATLDGNSVPVGSTVLVNKIDYHELFVWRTNTSTLATSNRLVRFVITTAGRDCCEWGLPPWTPYPFINSAAGEFAGANLRLLTPQDYPAGMDIPMIAWVENNQGHAVRVNGVLTATNEPSILIRRGVGSGLLTPAAAGTLNYAGQLPGLTGNTSINIENSTTWTPVSGSLSGSTTWPDDSRISITGNVTIPAGSSLTVGAGSVVRIASKVNVNLAGQITVNGTSAKPVVWTPFTASQPWGGIMMSNTAQVVASATIWTGSGGEPCFYSGGSAACGNVAGPSHRPEQALFHFLPGAGSLALSNCAAISLAGQFGHYTNGGAMKLDHVLIQRCTSGGQYSQGSIVMNDCAIIEVPADTDAFVDGDNDGMYLENGGYSFTNCLVGWTKDDGFDSGGGGGGVNNFINCWFESTYHEGISGSGDNKYNNMKGTVVMNCGQAFEDGYSRVTNATDNCLYVGNVTGARFGDNYSSGYVYTGYMSASNSFLLYNYRNVWGMTFNLSGTGVDTNQWVQRLGQMNVRNNYLSSADTNHPNNQVWNPATDGPLLTPFLNMPPDSPVGIGLAVRSAQLSSAALTAGVPVRLSRFAISPVSVQYSAESPSGTLASGTLQFAPGETVKNLDLSGLSTSEPLIRVSLLNPSGSELTSLSHAYVVNIPGPSNATLVAAGSIWNYLDTGLDQGTAWRTSAFSDASWNTGRAQLGFGDTDEATVVNGGPSTARFPTTYFRQTFSVTDPAAFTNLAMWLLRDDGGVVYLNGKDVYRSPSMPQPPTVIVYGSWATNQSVSTAPADNFIDTATLSSTNLVAGTNLVAVEIHQHDATSSDISFDFSLTGIPASTAPRLNLGRFSDELVAYWNDPAAVLEEASQITGPWTQVSAGTTAVSVVPQPGQKFYRLKK